MSIEQHEKFQLTYQDVGQLQMYVNYYDRYEKQDFEKPTIGIILCAEKNQCGSKNFFARR